MAEITKKKPAKAPKLADPQMASIDVASQQMIARSHELGVETVSMTPASEQKSELEKMLTRLDWVHRRVKLY